MYSMLIATNQNKPEEYLSPHTSIGRTDLKTVFCASHESLYLTDITLSGWDTVCSKFFISLQYICSVELSILVILYTNDGMN